MEREQADSSEPGQVLRDARAAVKALQYSRALILYERFFDHALDDDPAAFYGVRLSYCLHEWADLGKEYGPAKAKLEIRRQSSLSLLESMQDPERFHDYVAICRALGTPEEPIRQFSVYHEKNPVLAGQIVRFVWNQLVDSGRWDICSRYVLDAESHYEDKLLKFDTTIAVCSAHPDETSEDLPDLLKGLFIRDMRNLILVLANTGRGKELLGIRTRLVRDMNDRHYPDISAAALTDLPKQNGVLG